jgi:hypothetical protein
MRITWLGGPSPLARVFRGLVLVLLVVLLIAAAVSRNWIVLGTFVVLTVITIVTTIRSRNH